MAPSTRLLPGLQPHSARLDLLALQMAGTLTPRILFPAETFNEFLVPSLEGQYIIKNLVIITAAMVIGATVRGGRSEAEPPVRGEPLSARGGTA